MPVTPSTDNLYEKKIKALRNVLTGVSITPYGHEHEGILTTLGEAIEIVESLSVRAVNTSQQIKDLKLWGDQVMLDPSSPKDLEHVVIEMRDQIEELTKRLNGVEESATWQRRTDIIDAYMEAARLDLTCGRPIVKPNHFQKTVHSFAKHGNAIIATHRRSGKNVYCFRAAVDFALLHPDSKTLIFTARHSEDTNLHPFFPTTDVIKEGTLNPYTYTLTNDAVIQVIDTQKLQKNGSLCGQSADRVFITEAAMMPAETLNGLRPLMQGSPGRRPISTIMWTPQRSYEAQAHIIESFWNSVDYAQLRYPVTHNPDYADKIQDIRAQWNWEEFRFEWMAMIPEKPKTTHVCNCHPRKAF